MKVLAPGPESSGPGSPPGLLTLAGDDRLARLVTGGNERAFCTLYERYHQRVYRYCRSIVRDDADAQDALQSTFAAALVALRRDQRRTPLRPWLFRIAHNESVSILRRRPDAVELEEADGRWVGSAHEQVERRDRLNELLADLNELPERARGALLMRELSGLSHEEIAVALSTSVGAAKQAVFDARRGLQELADGRAAACEDIQRQLSDGDGRVLRARRVRAHVRGCQACATFAAAIPDRRRELCAVAPILAPAGAAALLQRVVTPARASGGGTSALASGTGAKILAGSLGAKALAGAAAVVVAAGAGVIGTAGQPRHRGGPANTRSTPTPRASAPARTRERRPSAAGSPPARTTTRTATRARPLPRAKPLPAPHSTPALAAAEASSPRPAPGTTATAPAATAAPVTRASAAKSSRARQPHPHAAHQPGADSHRDGQGTHRSSGSGSGAGHHGASGHGSSHAATPGRDLSGHGADSPRHSH